MKLPDELPRIGIESYRKDAVIFKQGGEAVHFYIVRRGQVAIEIGTLTIQTLHPGDVLGWSWLVPPYLWHFDARAVDEVELEVLDAAATRAMCDANPAMGYPLMREFITLIVERLQATRMQLMDWYGS